MKFEDTSQNLRARLRFVQILVVLMLSVLSVRLYVLQVVRGERYAETNKIRPAPLKRFHITSVTITANRAPACAVISDRASPFGTQTRP
jgi:cell division protein FtsI/penicillin-binding protein 2